MRQTATIVRIHANLAYLQLTVSHVPRPTSKFWTQIFVFWDQIVRFLRTLTLQPEFANDVTRAANRVKVLDPMIALSVMKRTGFRGLIMRSADAIRGSVRKEAICGGKIVSQCAKNVIGLANLKQ